MYFTLKMGFTTEISPKYCDKKAIKRKNNDFQTFFLQKKAYKKFT